MAESKKKAAPKKRAFESALDASILLQLTSNHIPRQGEDETRPGEDELAALLHVEPPETKVVSKLIDRIRKI